MKHGMHLSICADMHGCPNRCLHCWLSHMENRPMEKGADEWIVDKFRPYFETIDFYSWLREPDFCADYRAQWERDKALSVGCVPKRFELASFWRLVRDPSYVGFLGDVGVRCVQLTFFGLERTTDRYVGRKGAFAELLKANEILLENGIIPRWQCFINEENRSEIVELVHLAEKLELKKRCADIGGAFKLFVHEGSCEGENEKLYPVRISKENFPEELLPYFLDFGELRSESELCSAFEHDGSVFAPHNEDSLVLYVNSGYDLFFNFTHMRPEWRIGNLKTDPIDELVRRAVAEDTPALNAARSISLGKLVRLYGNSGSQRAFRPDDYKMYLLNRHIGSIIR